MKETRPNEAGTTPAAAPGVSLALELLEPEVWDGLEPSVGVESLPPVLDALLLVVEVRTTVVDGPTLMTNEDEFPWKMVVVPSGRPAGMVATSGMDVTTAG
ncbi:hypothetical protein RRF57_000117 [Xylaria bambusicola]|uniref:Uncharacterized protein n=1 Tax=Xylaria bambusicola TaxID=326684 RepID=A0AAN7UCC4_9PEZI